MPHPGEIVHASHTFEEPAGGGAVAAVQLRKLAGEAALFTAFGDDETGHRSEAELREHGVRVEARFHPEPQRRAFVHLTPGERTITVLGPRLGPSGAADLPWELLDDTDAVYLTAGDVEAVRQARRARTLVATPRGLDTLADAHVELDALVMSGRDAGERYSPGDLDPAPRLIVRTARGHRGRVGDRGRASAAAGARRRCPARCATPTGPATASPPASPTGWGRAGVWTRRSSLRPAAAPPASPAAGRTRASSSSDQATWPSAGSIGRPSWTHALQPAVEVVSLEARRGERLRGERRPAARAAVEDDRPLAVERLCRPGAELVELDVQRVRRCDRRRARTARARRPPARPREAALPRGRGRGPGERPPLEARLLALG